tara:strand:+ start:272 stop:502 length:231 start_codon:yes stop_codon:yes gene_type:complete
MDLLQELQDTTEAHLQEIPDSIPEVLQEVQVTEVGPATDLLEHQDQVVHRDRVVHQGQEALQDHPALQDQVVKDKI